jgi:hypothetical protein
MPTIEVDFETFKEITVRRPNEKVTEGDVVRAALGLPTKNSGLDNVTTRGIGGQFWYSEGVPFPMGTRLRHVYRGGKTAEAEITKDGVKIGAETFPGLSPAASFSAGHQANGWQFWEVCNSEGRWVKADILRQRRDLSWLTL